MSDLLTEPYKTQIESGSTTSSKFQQQLRDALTQITVTPELTIIHPGYELAPVSQTYQSYLQQISPSERDRYLISKLQRHLYDVFIGRQTKSQQVAEAAPAVNHGDRWYETEFYRQFLQANHGKGYSDPGWVLTGQLGQLWQAAKDGLNLFVDPRLHLFEPQAELTIGQTMAIRLPSSAIDRGVYIAVGDAGSLDSSNVSSSDIWQIYFNLDADTALVLLDFVSQELNHQMIPFELRLAYCDRDYQYLDAAILEFSKQDWSQVQPAIDKFYRQNKAGFSSEIPFFCQLLQSGLGLAYRGKCSTSDRQCNLGLEHCKIIAETIVKRLQNSNLQLQSSLDCIWQYIEQHKIAV